MIDAHVYSLPAELRNLEAKALKHEIAIKRAIYNHSEGSYALRLSDPSMIVKSMDESGIHKSVLVSLPWNRLKHCYINNNHVLEWASKSDRFYAVCSVSIIEEGYIFEAERVIKAGAIGLKINTSWQNQRLNSKKVIEIADYAAQKNVFLMVHVDHGFRVSKTSSAELFELARQCPETKIIAAHLGGLLGLYNLNKKVSPCLCNIWFDTAVSSTLEMVKFYTMAGLVDKLIFGSDFPFNHSHSQKQVVDGLKSLNFEDEELGKIFSLNLKSLAGI